MKNLSFNFHLSQFVVIASLTLVSIVSFQVNGSISVNIDHDLTQPTYGLEGKTGSSIKYDQQNGLNLGGTVADLLGPPIKIANGLTNLVKGNNMATVGTGLKTGGALLGLDARLIEAAGAGNLFKGNLLLNGVQKMHRGSVDGQTTAQTLEQVPVGQMAAKGQQTTEQVAAHSMPNRMFPTKGEKIANIIEFPVKVVAMKDIIEGKALTGLGSMKGAGAHHLSTKGQDMMSEAQALKMSGVNQIIQGANEGMQNIGNMFQKTANNMQSAFRLAPLVWDMQQQEAASSKGGQQQVAQQQSSQQQQQQVVKDQRPVSMAYQMSPPTGGSLFGGLASLMPSFGSNGPNPTYAAILNATDPLTRLLTSPNMSPFLLPFTSGPMGQALAQKQPIGTEAAVSPLSSALGGSSTGGLLTSGSGAQSFDFNFVPGVRYRETVSGSLPSFKGGLKTSGAESLSSTKTSQQAAQVETATKKS